MAFGCCSSCTKGKLPPSPYPMPLFWNVIEYLSWNQNLGSIGGLYFLLELGGGASLLSAGKMVAVGQAWWVFLMQGCMQEAETSILWGKMQNFQPCSLFSQDNLAAYIIFFSLGAGQFLLEVSVVGVWGWCWSAIVHADGESALSEKVTEVLARAGLPVKYWQTISFEDWWRSWTFVSWDDGFTFTSVIYIIQSLYWYIHWLTINS